MKLQDAFIAENGNVVGTFDKIGYEMAATGPFNYNDKVNNGTSGTVALGTLTPAWEAASKVALNDCVTGSTWTLKTKSATNGNGAAWEAAISTPSKCEVLTPRFSDLARGN